MFRTEATANWRQRATIKTVVIFAVLATQVYFLLRLQLQCYTHTPVSIGVLFEHKKVRYNDVSVYLETLHEVQRATWTLQRVPLQQKGRKILGYDLNDSINFQPRKLLFHWPHFVLQSDNASSVHCMVGLQKKVAKKATTKW